MATRKKGSIAIPFLVTFLIGLLIIGGFVFYLYGNLGMNQKEELDDMDAAEIKSATYEDSHTILFVLDVPEVKCSSTFIVMRSVPKEKKILLTGVPANTIEIIDGQQENLGELYKNSGVTAAEKFIETISGTEIDRYMIFNEEAFLKLSDILGGVSYAVTVDIAGFEDTDKEQYLNGKQALSLITYPLFGGGEFERASMAASVLSAMVNQSDRQSLKDGFERSFNTLINLTESNITAGDYKKLAYPIEFMIEPNLSNSVISHFSMLEGISDTDYFVLEKFYSDDIIQEYFTDKSEKKDSKKKGK